MKTFRATINDQGRTLLKFLYKMFPDVPGSRIERAFRQKDIKVNDVRLKDKKYVIKQGDIIVVYGLVTEDIKPVVIKANIQFEPLFEDENILIVSKKKGIQVHDGDNPLDKQVLAYLKHKTTDSFVPSHVGRLDKVTSGIMIYGKTYNAVRQLNDHQKEFKKLYEFRSDLSQPVTTEFKIKHDEDYQRERCGDEGKPTKTIFTMENGKKYAELKTGRKHQIRASLSKLGYPIYGDTRYGGKPARRVFLHATYLKLNGLEGMLAYLNGEEFWSRPEW